MTQGSAIGRACRLAAASALLALTACTMPPNSSLTTSLGRIYATNVPDGSLRAAQVVMVADAADVAPGTWGWQALRMAGVPEGEIGAGSIVIARVFCCGGEIEVATAPAAYVPKGMEVALGDFVEIWSDHATTADASPDTRPNRVTRVLQTTSSPSQACGWRPDNPNLWMRLVQCDWMPAAGWSQQPGMYPFWVKVVGPPPLATGNSGA